MGLCGNFTQNRGGLERSLRQNGGRTIEHFSEMSCTSAHAFDVRKQCLEIISDITNKQEDSSVDDINLARKWLLYYREVPTRLQGKLPR